MAMTEAPAAPYTQWYETQRQFFESGKTRSYAFRKGQLNRLKKCIRAHEEAITEALQQDLRKAPLESYTTEIGFVHGEINYTLKHLKEWMKPEKVDTRLTGRRRST
jgi:aldehyde dehydrogenase (NAD+)